MAKAYVIELGEKVEALEAENAQLKITIGSLRQQLAKSDPLEHCATSCDYCRQISEENLAMLEATKP